MHLFGGLFRLVVSGDVGEPHVLLRLGVPAITYFSLLVEADHHLVDDHADEGAEEGGENRHQEPTVSDTVKRIIAISGVLSTSAPQQN